MTNILLFAVLLFSTFSIFPTPKIEGQPSMKSAKKTEKFQVEKLSEQGQIAYKNLLTAEQFQDAYVGYAGSYSVLVKSLNELGKEKYADEAFKSLLNEAKIAGQLYALNGLFYTDHEFFKKAVEKYRKDETLVNRMSGCEIFSEKVSNIVESKSAVVAKVSPNETMEDFWKRNKVSYEVDILNGGFPATFRAADARNSKREKK